MNQKSELQRALEKHKDHQIKKELENEKSQNKTLLERVIEERARRLENVSILEVFSFNPLLKNCILLEEVSAITLGPRKEEE